MAVVALTGFEVGNIACEAMQASASFVGTIAYTTTHPASGDRCLRANPASSTNGCVSNLYSFVLGNVFHFSIYIATLPSLERRILGGGADVSLGLTSDGHIKVYGNAGSLLGTSNVAIPTGEWHRVAFICGTSVSRTVLYIDGMDAGVSASSMTAPLGQFGFSGGEASAVDVYLDDVIVTNSYEVIYSAFKVALLLPASDISVTSWQAGAGGTSNLWDGIDNIPPAGVASASETDTTNVEATTTSGVYEFNLTTYASLGIVAGDTIRGSIHFARHGEDINTGTKTGSFNSTNPGQPGGVDVAFTFGGDGGAHVAEPGVWTTTVGTCQNNPSITLGTTPTMTLRKTSGTRVGCVDFAGCYIAWIPLPVARVPRREQQYAQLIAG